MTGLKILVVDDEPNIVKTLARVLSIEGYSPVTAGTAEDALAMIRTTPIDCALIDVLLPGMDGLELLSKFKEVLPEMPVIMMSGHGTIETAVEATRRGAYSFIEKPLSSEKVLVTVINALRFSRLKHENETLRRDIEARFTIVGRSPVMLELQKKIELTAPTTGRVLILGENGTGKELIARSLHQQSRRRDQPFIKVNCAAIPKDLIESELFGHEKGSFTGAVSMRKGKFERADSGTLFLDEIGDMLPDMQAKLLRVLQEGEFERVGGTETLTVDVRIIAASNRNLIEEIERGAFREDLYYRLNVVPFVAPPLRNRTDDIPLLAEHFMIAACQEHGRPVKTLTREAMDVLTAYHWPGNVRELKNIIERLVILVATSTVMGADIRTVLPLARRPSPQSPSNGVDSLRDMLQRAEHDIIVQALEQNRWHVTNTARQLKIERSHLYKKLKQLGIDLTPP